MSGVGTEYISRHHAVQDVPTHDAFVDVNEALGIVYSRISENKRNIAAMSAQTSTPAPVA